MYEQILQDYTAESRLAGSQRQECPIRGWQQMSGLLVRGSLQYELTIIVCWKKGFFAL